MSVSTQAELRARALDRRRSLNDEARRRYSQTIVSRFLRSAHFLNASTIGCYLSLPDEVDTSGIFSRTWLASKRIYAPVTSPGRQLRFVEVLRNTPLHRSRFGLLEPASGDEFDPLGLDIVIVPVVAFDVAGNRIGMGGGYYDTTFAALNRQPKRRRPKLIGIAFECQKVRKIKANPWDIGVCNVLTEV